MRCVLQKPPVLEQLKTVWFQTQKPGSNLQHVLKFFDTRFLVDISCIAGNQQRGLPAAFRWVCKSEKLGRSPERPLTFRSSLDFAPAAKVCFPPLVSRRSQSIKSGGAQFAPQKVHSPNTHFGRLVGMRCHSVAARSRTCGSCAMTHI